MRKSDKTIPEQEAIIAEYLLGDTTYRKLGAKHGVDFRAIHHWVTRFQGKPAQGALCMAISGKYYLSLHTHYASASF